MNRLGILRGFFVRGGLVVLVRGLVVLGGLVVRGLVVRVVLGLVVRVVLALVRSVDGSRASRVDVRTVVVRAVGGVHEPTGRKYVPDRLGFSEHFSPEHAEPVTIISCRVNFESP